MTMKRAKITEIIDEEVVNDESEVVVGGNDDDGGEEMMDDTSSNNQPSSSSSSSAAAAAAPAVSSSTIGPTMIVHSEEDRSHAKGILKRSEAAEADAPDFPDMDQETAKKLFEQGAFLLFFDLPTGSEFGIDYHSWRIGDKFIGLKMIPPGVHFVYFSLNSSVHKTVAPRIGFFHDFKAKEVVVRRWNKVEEDMISDPSQADEHNLDRMKDLDKNLAAYPYQSLKKWFSLTNNIQYSMVQKVEPESGRITSQVELESSDSVEADPTGNNQRVDRDHRTRTRYSDAEGLPVMNVKPGHQLRWNTIDSTRTPGGLKGRELSIHGMDNTFRLNAFLTNHQLTEIDMLGEIQLSFIIFLIGQVYSGFEQWKKLVNLLCSSAQAVSDRPEMYAKFLRVLYHQLAECPKDFFVDIVSKDNFLTRNLSDLFENVETTDEEPSGRIQALKQQSGRFKDYLGRKFKWDFDLDEDAPVVVEIPPS